MRLKLSRSRVGYAKGSGLHLIHVRLAAVANEDLTPIYDSTRGAFISAT